MQRIQAIACVLPCMIVLLMFCRYIYITFRRRFGLNMGIVDLISKCCLEGLSMNFSDVNPQKVIKMSKDADRDWTAHPPHAVVDGNCWLYECSYYLARGLALGHEYETGFNAFLDRFMARYEYVTKRGFKAPVVFDGRRLSAKKNTDLKRQETREKNKKLQPN